MMLVSAVRSKAGCDALEYCGFVVWRTSTGAVRVSKFEAAEHKGPLQSGIPGYCCPCHDHDGAC